MLVTGRRTLFGVFLFSLGMSSMAAPPTSSEVIVAREYVGIESYPDETLDHLLGVALGEPLDRDRLNEGLHRIWEGGAIENVSVESESRDDGVSLRVIFEERPLLVALEYGGNERVDRRAIEERIAEESIEVREGDPMRRGELERLGHAIESLYRERGFPLSVARHRVDLDGRSARVRFEIFEGDRVRIGEIDFEGNTVYSDRRLRFAMKKTKERSLLARLGRRDVLRPERLESDLESVRDLYRAAGYKNVLLDEVERSVAGSEEPESAAPPELRLTVPIEEGARWTLGELEVTGNEAYADELLLAQFEAPRGGWLRSAVVEGGVEAIRQIYANTGYLFAQVDYDVIEREGEIADVSIEIDEGDRFRIGRIEFEGNTRTRDKVLRRELGSVQEGAVLNSSALRTSLFRLGQLEYFTLDEAEPVEFDFDRETQTVDLAIRGSEGDRTELLFGGGLGEQEGLFGTLSFQTRNFLGRGETATASLQAGEDSDEFQLAYSVPWLFDRPQSLGFQASDRSVRYDLGTNEVESQSVGGAVTYGRNLGLFDRVSLNYSYADVEELQRIADPMTGELFEALVAREISSARFAYDFDRIDSRFEPTEGRRYGLALEYAGGALGGTTQYLRTRASLSAYRPLSTGLVGTVLGFNAEAGHIEPLGERLFSQDRFFLGGENSVRGFSSRSLWARDDDGVTLTDETGLLPLGGDSFSQLNFELHLVSGGPLRALLFADAGAVVARDQSFDLDRFRTTAGIELRLNVPLLGQPLRLIFSENLDPRPDDRFEKIQFSFGTTF